MENISENNFESDKMENVDPIFGKIFDEKNLDLFPEVLRGKTPAEQEKIIVNDIL